MSERAMTSDAQLIRSRGAKARAQGKTHLDNPWDPKKDPKKHQWWFEGWSWCGVRKPKD